MDFLNVVPYDMDGRGINLRTTDWRQDLAEQVKRFQPNLIAISSTEDMWELGMHILEEVKEYKLKNQTPVIAGGVFPTFAPDIAISWPLVDMVCVGEGEHALIDLCEKLEKGHNYNDVTNLWVKQPSGSIKKNSVTKAVDINELPMIDVGTFEDARLYRPMSGRVYRMLPIETIRGCPYKCSFCNSPSQMSFYKEETNSRFLRKKKMDLVYKELRYFKDELNLEYAYFWADTFLAMNSRELDEFCEMYSDIKLPFWMQTRPETINHDNIRKLSEVGLHRISFGLEHGNEKFRSEMLDRQWKNEDIIKALRIPHQYGVQFSVNNITGFPKETREIAMDTVELNREIMADNANIYSFVPFHGTPLRKICEDLGLIKHETITKCLTDAPVFEMEQYSIDEIMGLRKCFILYTTFPKSRWKDIERAEPDTPEGNRIFAELKEEYMDRYFKAPTDNPNAEIAQVADLEYGVQQSG
ncbi:B12-binding domain-containing radical SAM protein [Terasakiella sp. A23]|uniref:B12-binding domain-containing radical SAM protein n=1 Tax=Terasakiella sp. FCG-A23 TaxID=3080561 RepID=UPI003986D929